MQMQHAVQWGTEYNWLDFQALHYLCFEKVVCHGSRAHTQASTGAFRSVSSWSETVNRPTEMRRKGGTTIQTVQSTVNRAPDSCHTNRGSTAVASPKVRTSMFTEKQTTISYFMQVQLLSVVIQQYSLETRLTTVVPETRLLMVVSELDCKWRLYIATYKRILAVPHAKRYKLLSYEVLSKYL